MFGRIFTRQNDARQTNVRETNVRQLDGQFIIIIERLPDGTINYRYENDRTNMVYNTLECWCK